MLKSDLQKLQYCMYQNVKKYHMLMKKKRSSSMSDNPALQREIKEILYELISLNDRQKIVISCLRKQKQEQDNVTSWNQKSDEHLTCEVKEEPCDSTPIINSCPEEIKESLLSTTHPFQDITLIKKEPEDPLPDAEETYELEGDLPEEVDEASRQRNRLEQIRKDLSDPVTDDVHDLVTADEFMHAVGLLTVRECNEVLDKRSERRKNSTLHQPFSTSLWEKSDSKRKKRSYLASNASPPSLRRKMTSSSQPPSRQNSRQGSPTGSVVSTPSTTTPQPQSPESGDNYTISEEVCPICKIKGASIQCDGCGVMYHGSCVEVDDQLPPQWLCPTCEQLGLRSSSSTYKPVVSSRRRETLALRDHLLHQRADLTVVKGELEQRRIDLALEIQETRRKKEISLEKERNVLEAIHRLKVFIAFFQNPNKLEGVQDLSKSSNISKDVPRGKPSVYPLNIPQITVASSINLCKQSEKIESGLDTSSIKEEPIPLENDVILTPENTSLSISTKLPNNNSVPEGLSCATSKEKRLSPDTLEWKINKDQSSPEFITWNMMNRKNISSNIKTKKIYENPLSSNITWSSVKDRRLSGNTDRWDIFKENDICEAIDLSVTSKDINKLMFKKSHLIVPTPISPYVGRN